MTIVRFEGRALRLDEHHTFVIDWGRFGVRLFVNDRWWMPPKAFPPGFDQEQAEFDTVESAAQAIQLVYNLQVFVWLDEEGDVLEIETPQAYTCAMSDTFQAHEGNVAEFREKLHYVDGACGLAVAIGNKVVAVDLFDKAATCRKVWQRLLSGYVLDALEANAAASETEPNQAEAADVERLLATASVMPWHKADPVGEGDEYRASQGDDVHASALTLDGSPVHVSVVVAG
jgi:hypothetical protein